jgi:hypothetical protein
VRLLARGELTLDVVYQLKVQVEQTAQKIVDEKQRRGGRCGAYLTL